MKHVHHDLIVEWVKDTSRVVQVQLGSGKWGNATHPNWDEDVTYRFKPRELIKGHWYPCIDSDGDKAVFLFNGFGFVCSDNSKCLIYTEETMKWIGESLGELKLGD
jgi:hypothetical protein